MANMIAAVIPQLGTTVIAFVFLLGVLVIIHECGHYIMAKRGGVRVDEFSIGFGPLLGRLFRHGETAFNLRALPFGGFVRMAGMEPDDAAEDGYNARPISTRAGIIVAGAAVNLVFGFLLIVALGLTYGLPADKVVVNVVSVKPGAPAAVAGILPKDRILTANGKEVTDMEALHDTIQASAGKPIRLDVERGGARVHIVATPARITAGGAIRGQLGILMTADYVWVRHGLVSSVQTGWKRSTALASGIIKTLFVRETWTRRELGGPIAIAQEAGGSAHKGLNYYLLFMAIFSINLGVLNLLPLPVLDGGHIVLLLIEAVRRRRLSTRFVIAFQSVGMAILFAFIVFVTVSDIRRAIGKG